MSGFPQVHAFECRVKGADWTRVVHHLTAGKARYDYLLDLRDAYPDATFADIVVRKLPGPLQTSEAFRRTAAYRGRPELHVGAKVIVRATGEDRLHGVVVGHNESANFNVLCGDGPAAGQVLSVHPSELVSVPAAGEGRG